MSRTRARGNNLGPLQKDIILCLARNGPQDISETAKALHGHYKSTHVAFESLVQKGLIQPVREKEYRGQRYPQFWLTFEGLMLALVNHANQDILKQTQESLHGKNAEIDLVFEMARILPDSEINEIYNQARAFEDGLEIYFPTNPRKWKIFRKALKKSPKYQAIVSRILDEAAKEMRMQR
jgi:DNA-binding MarR family transcriptional regulator